MSATDAHSQDRDLRTGDAAPATPSAHRPYGTGGVALPLRLPGEALTLLAIIAAHDRVSPADFLTRAICARAEAIGLPSHLQGREEASPLVHTQEVGRSNRPYATSITPERSDHGGGGNPAAPAGAQAPP